MIELKRELHWKWNRNGLLEVSKGFVGCNAGHSRDNYSSVCWTCIESAQRSKSYSIKLIWRCSKRVQWPNSKISLTKYSSLVSQDLWANTYLLSAVYGVSIVWYNMIYREMHGCETMKVALYSPCCHRLLTALAIYVQYMCIGYIFEWYSHVVNVRPQLFSMYNVKPPCGSPCSPPCRPPQCHLDTLWGLRDADRMEIRKYYG